MTQLKLILAAVLFALGLFCGWYPTANHYRAQIAEQQVAAEQAVQAQLIQNQQAAAAHAAKIKTAEEQHAKDQLALNNLRDQLGRVQIHIPSGCTLPGSAAAGTDPDRSAGLFPNRVDAAFAELQAGVGQLLERCDQLNLDARQAAAR